MDSKGDSLLRVEGAQHSPYIAPPLGEGQGWGSLKELPQNNIDI